MQEKNQNLKMVAWIKSIFISTLLIVFSSFAHAKVTIETITGASANFKPGDDIVSKHVIYAGLAGSVDDCDPADVNNSSTCNNCTKDTSNEKLGCNKTRVYPSLNLALTIKSDSAENGIGTATMLIKGSVIPVEYAQTGVTQTATITIPWSVLCDKLGAGTDCTTNVNVNDAYVGFDKDNDNKLDDSLELQFRVVNPPTSSYTHTPCTTTDPVTNEGLCNFTIGAGDEKVYVNGPKDDTIEAVDTSTYPSSGIADTNWVGVAFFYEEVDENATDLFSTINLTSTSKILTLTTEGTKAGESKEVFFGAGGNIIDGLKNNHFYCFRMANIDKAGNIYRTSSNEFLKTNNGTAPDYAFCGKPDEVVGLLKDQKCFIATATYGSPLAPQVKMLREFRNKYLIPFSMGRKIVHFYYKHSPYFADLIIKSPLLKTISWMMMAPVIGVIAIWMSEFFWVVFLLFGILAGLITWAVVYKPRTRLF